MTRVREKGLSNPTVGLIAILVMVLAFYLAFTKSIPFINHPYEVKAMFKTANNVTVNSEVRIAGVKVGKISKVEQVTGDDGKGQEAALVTMELLDKAKPLHKDATMALRPRLFLEGNFFIDLKPGSPASDELESGETLSVTQTNVPVQIDEVLTTLQADTRENLQILLKELGSALDEQSGEGGAKGFRDLIKASPKAFSATSQVNEALLGTRPHDLSGFIKNLDRVVRGLSRNEGQLKSLITNFRITAGSFAAEDQALAAAINELPNTLNAARPALTNLNTALPSLRAFAREALPGVRSSGPTLDASRPFIAQARRLVSRKELRGLTRDLKPTAPRLARLADSNIDFLEEGRGLASCFNKVIIPWSNETVPDPSFGSPGRIYEETGYGLVGIAGESRSGDANGQYIRVAAGGGANTVAIGGTFGTTLFPLQGARPAITSSAKTPFRPDVPCENQQKPNLNAGGAAAPPTQTSAPRSALSSELGKLSMEQMRIYIDDMNEELATRAGQRSKAKDIRDDLKDREKGFTTEDRKRFLELIGLDYDKRKRQGKED